MISAGRRAVIYARVSKDDQAKEGYSLPSQLKRCREHAQRAGLQIVAEFQDDYTGRKASRPQLDKALKLLRTGQADTLVVLSRNRFMRNTREHIRIRDELRELGATLAYAEEGGDLDTSADGLMFDNLGANFSEWWSNKISEAVRRGLREKAEQGHIPGMGGARYGYRHVDGQLVVHEPEARIVRQIFQLYTIGDESGQRLQTPTIANRLNALQVPPPVINNNRRMKRAPQWSAPTLLRILADEIYAGRYVYGARTSYRRRTKSAAAPIELTVPAIVDQDTWLATVARRESNRINAARNTKRFYLMRGLLRCSCGRAMIGHHNVRSNITRYECSGYHNGFKCGQRHVRAEIVHREIWTNVWQLLNVQDFAGFIRAQAEMEQQRHSDKAARLAEIERTIGERKAEAERLALAIAKGHAGALGEALERTAHEIDDHLAALRAEQREIRTALGIVQISDAQLAGVSEFRAAVLAGHAHATDQEKRAVLEALNVRAIIKGHQLRLSYHFAAPIGVDSNAYTWEYTSQLSLTHTIDLVSNHANI